MSAKKRRPPKLRGERRLLPLRLMLLGHLASQPGQSASYAELRAACKLDDPSSLSHAVKRLVHAGWLETFASAEDARKRGLRLLEPGRDALRVLQDDLKVIEVQP